MEIYWNYMENILNLYGKYIKDGLSRCFRDMFIIAHL